MSMSGNEQDWSPDRPGLKILLQNCCNSNDMDKVLGHSELFKNLYLPSVKKYIIGIPMKSKKIINLNDCCLSINESYKGWV
jgi:hypothetical protein